MIHKKGFVFVLALAVSLAFVIQSSADMGGGIDKPVVSGWFLQEMENDRVILDPGDSTLCNRDFTVRNESREMAEVGVILGNGDNYAFHQVAPGKTLHYSLESGYESSITGGITAIDEARIVNTTGGVTPLKVECK
ncbi:MAG: hypothetical protein ACE5G9_11490 [Nitrospinales bacterium]